MYCVINFGFQQMNTKTSVVYEFIKNALRKYTQAYSKLEHTLSLCDKVKIVVKKRDKISCQQTKFCFMYAVSRTEIQTDTQK